MRIHRARGRRPRPRAPRPALRQVRPTGRTGRQAAAAPAARPASRTPAPSLTCRTPVSSRSLAAAGPQNWTFGLGQYTRSGGEEAAAAAAAAGPEQRPRRVGSAFLARSRPGTGSAHRAPRLGLPLAGGAGTGRGLGAAGGGCRGLTGQRAGPRGGADGPRGARGGARPLRVAASVLRARRSRAQLRPRLQPSLEARGRALAADRRSLARPRLRKPGAASPLCPAATVLGRSNRRTSRVPAPPSRGPGRSSRPTAAPVMEPPLPTRRLHPHGPPRSAARPPRASPGLGPVEPGPCTLSPLSPLRARPPSLRGSSAFYPRKRKRVPPRLTLRRRPKLSGFRTATPPPPSAPFIHFRLFAI